MQEETETPQPLLNGAATLPPITTAAEWRKRAKQCYLLTLPSGVTVKARRPDMTELVAAGIIDAHMLASISQSVPQGDDDARRARADVIAALGRAVAPVAILEPVIVPAGGTPDEASIMVTDIGLAETTAILFWCMGLDSVSGIVSKAIDD